MARKAKTTSKELENEKTTTKGARRVSAKNPRKNGSSGKPKRGKADSVESDGGPGDSDDLSNAYKSENEGEESDLVLLDSDGLDDSDFETSAKEGQKRKRGSGNTKASPKKKAGSAVSSPKKAKGNAAKKRKKPSSDDEEEEGLEDGLEVVGTVVEAPKTGRVPPGQISQNTFNFLRQLQDPKCNDRIWFKLHEPVFRQAEKEWKDFINVFTLLLTEADPQIPVLPPNDVTHRIYRDVRFSNDKTPYKTNFSASFSRSGRKGIFAAYHVSIKPGGSIFAAGSWCPGKNELQTIRNNILRSSRRLRQLISAPDFVELFGEPKPNSKSERANIFGRDDELKVAPKGIDKNHKDIDLLKCRSFAVMLRFTDKEVLDPGFKTDLQRIVTIVRPFVHGLNDMMTIAPDEPASDSEPESGGEAEDGENN